MAECAERIRDYSKGLDCGTFSQRGMAYDAILRSLEVLGEAAKGVPADMRVRHPEVEWRSLAGLRDVLIHRYAGLEDETIWDVVVNKIPGLLPRLEHILESSAGDSAGDDLGSETGV